MEVLYVCQGRDGLMKVGRTRSVFMRVHGLRKQFRAKGDELVRMEQAGDAVPRGVYAENRLLERLSATHEPVHGKEWFRGIPFDVARTVAIESVEATRWLAELRRSPRATPEEIEGWRRRGEAQRIAAAEARARWLAEKELRLAPMRAKRICPERVMSQFIAYALATAEQES